MDLLRSRAMKEFEDLKMNKDIIDWEITIAIIMGIIIIKTISVEIIIIQSDMAMD